MVPFVVGFGGTTREGSSSERLGRAVLDEVGKLGARTQFFDGGDLKVLPHYAPEAIERTSEQARFVEAIRQCDGLVIATPAYHGGVSGIVKNAIDLLEDLRGDERVYFSDRPVGLVVAAAGWLGCGTTLSGLRDIVHAMRGWPTPLGVIVNTLAQKTFGEAGELVDEKIALQVQELASQVFGFAQVASSRRTLA